jgi:hypothetical protein
MTAGGGVYSRFATALTARTHLHESTSGSHHARGRDVNVLNQLLQNKRDTSAQRCVDMNVVTRVGFRDVFVCSNFAAGSRRDVYHDNGDLTVSNAH